MRNIYLSVRVSEACILFFSCTHERDASSFFVKSIDLQTKMYRNMSVTIT